MVWAEAVHLAAGVPYTRLGDVLGDDGKWEGLWSRYKIGASSPSLDRVRRIGNTLSGTARFYMSPLWMLLEERDYSKKELDDCVNWLQPSFRDHFIPFEERRFGRRWEVHRANSFFFPYALQAVATQELALDAITAILICIREAEWLEDSRGYLRAVKAWASLTTISQTNFVLLDIQALIPTVLEPLRHRRFYPQEIDDIWMNHVREMEINSVASEEIDDMDLVECLIRLRL